MVTIHWAIIGLTLLAVITPWLLKAIFPHKVCVKEIAISTVVSLVIAGISFAVFTATTPTSIELWNGEVTNKQQVRVRCSHSYQCNCVNVCTGSGETRTCNRVCQTCYRHTHDYDWRVFTSFNNGNHFINIPRIDSQGRRMPPRWSEVIIGEPFSKENRYRDYIRAAQSSLFYSRNHERNEVFQELIPEYPRVFDFYRSTHVFQASTNPIFSQDEINRLNHRLRTRLAIWGPMYQMNMIFVFTDQPRDFMTYMVNEWQGGRKNDAIIFINVNEDMSINWIDIHSWSRNEFFNSIIRAEMISKDKFDKDETFKILADNVSHFDRIEMEEFRYLLSERKYHWWQILIMLILQLGGNAVLGYFVAKERWFT